MSDPYGEKSISKLEMIITSEELEEEPLTVEEILLITGVEVDYEQRV